MFYSDVNTAVLCLRPLLKLLKVRCNNPSNMPVSLKAVPELDFLGLDNWTLVLIKEDSGYASGGRFFTRYHKELNLWQSYIFLDKTLYYDTDTSRKKRKIVAVHEFCHFVALIYAYEAKHLHDDLFTLLEKKFSNNLIDIFNPHVIELYKLLIGEEDPTKSLSTFTYTQHSHFFIGCEEIGLSYTDLFLNLLFSRGAFEEFFTHEQQVQFFELWLSGKRVDAMKLYDGITQKAAKEKWVPNEFAFMQSHTWLAEYFRNPVIPL